jgi:membrane-bound lytic murein transglycosylase B
MNCPESKAISRQYALAGLSTGWKGLLQRYRRMTAACCIAVVGSICLAPSAIAQQMLTGRADVEGFLDDVAGRYQFDRKMLGIQFAGVTIDPVVLRYMQPVAPGKRSWETYRADHIDRMRIVKGSQFLVKHRTKLKAAEQAFGVPAEIITAILGIETNYGADKGSFRWLSGKLSASGAALSTW